MQMPPPHTVWDVAVNVCVCTSLAVWIEASWRRILYTHFKTAVQIDRHYKVTFPICKSCILFIWPCLSPCESNSRRRISNGKYSICLLLKLILLPLNAWFASQSSTTLQTNDCGVTALNRSKLRMCTQTVASFMFSVTKQFVGFRCFLFCLCFSATFSGNCCCQIRVSSVLDLC